MKKLLAALALFFPLITHAACTGSGLTWACTTAGFTNADLQSAINTASDGATITFAAGTYAVTGVTLDNRNGITLICTTPGTCSINDDLPFIHEVCSANKTNLMRISGFAFTGTPGVAFIWVYCNSDITKLRIDNNSFNWNGSGIAAIHLGESTSTGNIYGVIDNNVFHTTTDNRLALKNVTGSLTWVTGRKGTANNLFFEDNTITVDNNTDNGQAGVDIWRANGTVLRFNNVTNSRLESHSLCHGGPSNFEAYYNNIANTAQNNYRNLHSQGSGEITWFNNIVASNGDGNAMAIQHYRSDATQLTQGDCDPPEICDGDWVAASGIPLGDGNRAGGFGYPCWHQPGRDAAGTLKPVYVWNNRTAGGTVITPEIQSGSYSDLGTCSDTDANRINCHIRRDRDWYFSSTVQVSPTSPFNGTTGVGFGTLANRPTTCTAGPGGADGSNGGVAYWATNAGNWNGKVGAEQGVLYRCSATNTWTVDYSPYPYPHPLRVRGGPAAPVVN